MPKHTTEEKLEFIVIVKTDDKDVASDFMFGDTVVDFWWDKSEKYDFEKLIHIKTPVFVEGEIIIADSRSGREVDGHQRKPSKWYVEYETYKTLEEAVNRSRDLFESHFKKD